MPFFNKFPLSFSLLYWFILRGLLSYFRFIFCSNIFPRVYVKLKFYEPENFIQLFLLPDSRYVIWHVLWFVRVVLLTGSNWNATRFVSQLEQQLAITRKVFQLFKTTSHYSRWTPLARKLFSHFWPSDRFIEKATEIIFLQM